MEKKHYLLNVTIQIDAHSEDEALEILSQEEVLKSIVKAIENNKENLQEINAETTNGLIN